MKRDRRACGRTPPPASPTGTGNAIFPSRKSILKWIQKGGGYYSECNKRLKGQA
jgi:hypothetical protein